MRVAALGRTRMLWNAIQCIASCGHQITLIATCRAAPEYSINEDDFRNLAAELGAEFLLTQSLNDAKVVNKLRNAAAEVAVSINWINIVGHEAVECFPLGILNAHAGDLPRYRGNAPVAWAMLQGEQKIGITIHQMDPQGLDSGPIVLKDYFPISDNTYISEVFKHLEQRIPEMFSEALNRLANDKFVRAPQSTDPSLALRCYPRRPEDGYIRWENSAVFLARLVRVSAEPFAGAFTFFRGDLLRVWRATPEPWPSPSLAVPGQVVWRNLESGAVGIATGEGVLAIQEVESIQHGRCHPASLITSLRDRLGREA